MTTEQVKLIKKLTATVEKVFVCDAMNVIFQKRGKTFCLMIDRDGGFTIYQAVRSGGEWQIGYNSAQGENLRFIDDFIAEHA